MYLAVLSQERTEEDVEWFRRALRLQQDNPLPAHCHVDAFVSKAYAFCTKVNPFLQQPYKGEDIGASSSSVC